MKKVIVNLKGGLGNQFFCYALGYSVARKNNAKLVLDTSLCDTRKIKDRYLELLNFDVKYDDRISYKYVFNPKLKKLGLDRFIRRANIGLGTVVFSDPNYLEYHKEVFEEKRNIYLDGYFQSHFYFDEYKEDIIKMLVPTRNLSDSALRLLQAIKETNSVSLHVRRGDYVDASWALPMHYYDEALKKIRALIEGNLTIYVFTDDKEFAREYLDKLQVPDSQFVYTEYESDNYTADDIYLMSKCKNNITANSTFSWWAAYFNDNKNKIVICPDYSVWTGDFYPKDWKKIRVE